MEILHGRERGGARWWEEKKRAEKKRGGDKQTCFLVPVFLLSLPPRCDPNKNSLSIFSLSFLLVFIRGNRRRERRFVKREAIASLPSLFGNFRVYGYRNSLDNTEHLAIVKGDLKDFPEQEVLVRVHSECLTGNTIAVQYSKDKILLGPDEKVPLTLTVGQNIANSQSVILIPAGTQVVGELRTVSGGAQFFASELVFATGRRVAINGTSRIVTTSEKVDKGISAGKIVQNAALGAAAAAAIAAVTGDRAIATEEVLGGAGIGTLLGLFLGRDSVTLASINPNRDLNVTLNSDLLL